MPMKSYKGKRTLGVITARGGSKGIPGKNIRELCGKSLISYSIEAAQKSVFLTRCIVSTDAENIARIARDCGGDVPFMRPAELALDSTPSMAVIQHALSELKDKHDVPYDYLMILQPTSPLRTSADIDACIQLVVDSGADSVMSMVEMTDFSAKKVKRIKEGTIVPYFSEEGKESSRRQDAEPAYVRNCAIYLTRTDLIERGDLFGSVSRAYLMPRERSVDINTAVDFETAEFWMKKLGSA